MASFDVTEPPFSAYPEVEPPPKPEIEPLLPPQSSMSQSNTSDASYTLALPPLASYPSKEALFEAIQSWSKLQGYAFITQQSKRLGSRLQRVQYTCDHWDRWSLKLPSSQRTRTTQTRGTGCLFSVLGLESDLGWEVRYRLGAQFNSQNHPPSQSPAVYPSHQYLSIQAQATSQTLFSAGKCSIIYIEL
jgi:hypothetical protein